MTPATAVCCRKFSEKALFGSSDGVGILSLLCTQTEKVRGHNDGLVETIYVHLSFVGWQTKGELAAGDETCGRRRSVARHTSKACTWIAWIDGPNKTTV